MKIAITGSHGVGKSTLAADLLNYLNREEKLKNAAGGESGGFKKLDETARQALDLGFPINENNSPETQIWIFAKQLEIELLARDNYIADKCFIDSLAYAMYIFKERQDLLSTLKDLARRAAQKYDLVIYLPAGEFPIEDDGARSTDPKFQEGVDRLILEILNDFGISYVKVTGNKEDRAKKTIELIKTYLDLQSG